MKSPILGAVTKISSRPSVSVGRIAGRRGGFGGPGWRSSRSKFTAPLPSCPGFPTPVRPESRSPNFSRATSARECVRFSRLEFSSSSATTAAARIFRQGFPPSRPLRPLCEIDQEHDHDHEHEHECSLRSRNLLQAFSSERDQAIQSRRGQRFHHDLDPHHDVGRIVVSRFREIENHAAPGH